MTAPLRSRLAELRDVLAGHASDELEAQKVGRLTKRAEAVARDAERLEQSAAIAAELRDEGVLIELDLNIDQLVGALDEARTHTSEDPLWAGGDDRPRIASVLADAATRVREAVDRAWERHRERNGPPSIDQELLDLAGRDHPGLAARVEWLLTRLMVLGQKASPTAEDVAAWTEASRELREQAVRVSELAPSEAVVAFIRAASGAGAPIEQLDHPEVREWLGAHPDRVSRYTVRSRER
ncbi:MAG: hypothetical protein WD942_06220 [Dehalococcoidia bacterium]